MKRLWGDPQDSGFTIVELLVAIIIGAVVIPSANLIISAQARLSQQLRDTVLTNSFVESKVESLRSAGFATLSNGTTSITSELPSELNSPRNGSVQISTYSDSVKKISITISYNDRGISRTHSYSTLIGELGVGQN